MKAKPETAEKEGDETKGVPGFWLTIFNNVEMLAEMIQASPQMISTRPQTKYWKLKTSFESS